ncbi:MAG TPA: addiction module protein [Pyrinomonadaceae bacterium]|nr:addiction module protein [Pyrinomonadaceae bacterium]
MSSPVPFPPPGFEELSRAEQVEYAEKLSDYVTSDEKYVEIPEWHREILEKAMARYEEVGMEGRTWEEFEQALTKEGLFKLG